MKNLILSSVLLAVVFVSCKKDNAVSPASHYGVSATMNGQKVTFNYTVLVDTARGLFLQAARDTSVNSDIIWISISGGNLKPGTYSYLSVISGTATYYMNQNGLPSPFNSKDATVTITSISNNAVQGTFQGTNYHYTQNDRGVTVVDSTIKITDGSFNVRIPSLTH